MRLLLVPIAALVLTAIACANPAGPPPVGPQPEPKDEPPAAQAEDDRTDDADEQEDKTPREKVTIKHEQFKLELAVDDEARARGLMHREKIDDHGGMLFVFPNEDYRAFWMANCLVDIDIMYLDRSGRIVRMYEMKAEPPQGDREPDWMYWRRMPRYPSRRPAQFVIELKAGSLKRLQPKVGETIELDLKKLKALAK